jgi:hypothetical protein
MKNTIAGGIVYIPVIPTARLMARALPEQSIQPRLLGLTLGILIMYHIMQLLLLKTSFIFQTS